jgi:TonB family protein
MSVNDTTMPGPPPSPGPPGVNSNGWLGSQSIFDRRDERRLGRAFSASIAAHGGLLALLIIGFGTPAAQLIVDQIPLEYKVVFLPEAGPGGGGGGSPAPAPPKPIEIPKHRAPDPVPVVVETPKPVEPPPIPQLVAPIETTAANLVQSSGTASISLAPYGGGGRGGGVGSGTGNGVGPGTGGGFGGGAYRPGAGIENPTVVRQVQPKYTSDAMRAKIQGMVEVEAVVLENGTVGEVRILKSLDRNFGLDSEALTAARQWLFRPATRQGKAVPIIVIIQLEFRLH